MGQACCGETAYFIREKEEKIDVEGYIVLQIGKVQKGVKNGNSVLL